MTNEIVTAEAAPDEATADAALIRLMPLSEDQTDAVAREELKQEVARLTEQAARAEDPLAGIEQRLQAARLVLARGLEPACSRWLLAIPLPALATNENAWDKAKASVTASDRAWLKQAPDLLSTVADDIDSLEGVHQEAAGPLSHQRKNLERFARALEASLIIGDDAEAQRRRAASGLSVLLEENDEETARAAALWYAALRGFEGDREPAQSVLRSPLEPIKRSMSRYDFWGRLHRCRLSANIERPAGTLALIIQMEEYCDDWFPSVPAREAARASLSSLRLEIFEAWLASIPESRPRERAYCAARIVELQNALQDAVMFRLGSAIPAMDDQNGE